MNRPCGLALWHNFLYVAEADSVKRYVHNPAGDKLYVGVGSQENVDRGEDPRRAAINRYNPDGTNHEIFASGTRNPAALHWYPNTNTLWVAVQGARRVADSTSPSIPAGNFPPNIAAEPFWPGTARGTVPAESL